MKNPILVLCFLFIFCFFESQAQTISITTGKTTLMLKVGEKKKLFQNYFGKKVPDIATNALPQHEAYITAGTDNLLESAIRIIHTDGNPSLDLDYISHSVVKKNEDVTLTTIILKDPVYPVEVDLYYESFFKENIIKTWTKITNNEKGVIQLSNYASSMLHFDAASYWLTQFHGDFAKEMKMEESCLTHGIKILDSKLGTRSNLFQPPFFTLSLNGPADENNGEVIQGTLAWTGNFQFAFEIDAFNSLRVISGINPYASIYQLGAGKSFDTPEFIFTYSENGTGQASRNFHDWAIKYGIMDGTGPRLTLLNNWESTGFDFNEGRLSKVLDEAKTLGVDMFLLDDGWFGNKYPRSDDKAGLGDWQVNQKKLPSGLSHLSREANDKGLKFGIWLEPEMVNPKSELYEKHPDWILKLPNREENYFRNQLVLDLLNPRVQDFVYNTIDKLLSDNPGIAYIKWDCNRMMTNTYSPYLKNNQSNLYVDYTRSFYTVLERIRQKYPHLPIMLCAGGGGRTDYGGLKYFTEFWPSDDTDGLERVFIQWGYSYFFPSFAIVSHVTSWGKEPLKFRTDVAMMGKLGYDINVSQMSADELRFSQQAVQTYKSLSAVIWHGDLYHLVSPYKENRAVLLYVSKAQEKAVLFAYTLHTRYGSEFAPVKLKSLDPKSSYLVEETNLFPGTTSSFHENGQSFSGAYLMDIGLHVSSGQELSSAVITITRVE
jgi:alpha-galactosidase